ncbi:MAG: hypothetical protein ACF8MJ_09380 [Phycisphaerales bacterium JB050]
MDEPTSKDLMLPATEFVLATLSILFGIPGFGVGANAVAFADSYRSRRKKRRADLLRAIVASLEERTADIEDAIAEDQDDRIDLFVEVINKAIDDDEQHKEEFYSGVLEWIMREKPSRSQVRVLSDAVRQLTTIELVYFVREMNGERAQMLIERELPEQLVISRLEAHGLSSGGVRMHGNPTSLGKVLKKYISVDLLPRIS